MTRYRIWYDPEDASLVIRNPGPRAQLRQEFVADSWEAALVTFARYAALDRVLLR